jgi:hypothetical protein
MLACTELQFMVHLSIYLQLPPLLNIKSLSFSESNYGSWVPVLLVQTITVEVVNIKGLFFCQKITKEIHSLCSIV